MKSPLILVFATFIMLGCAGSPAALNKMSPDQLKTVESPKDLCFAADFYPDSPELRAEVRQRGYDCDRVLRQAGIEPKHPKSAAPPAPTASGCEGIELMGLGTTGKVAGVEVFGAKIRNATNLTRIVEVEYRLRGKIRTQISRAEVAPGAIKDIILGPDRPEGLKLSACR